MKKGLSLTMTVIVSLIVLSVLTLLIITLTNSSFSGVTSNLNNLISTSGETAMCQSLRSKCQAKCSQQCQQGGSGGQVQVTVDGETITCGSDSKSCTDGWTCEC